jgi:hypothetical protein
LINANLSLINKSTIKLYIWTKQKMDLNFTPANDDPNAPLPSDQPNRPTVKFSSSAKQSSQQKHGKAEEGEAAPSNNVVLPISPTSSSTTNNDDSASTFSHGQLNPPSISDPTTELTEEDIFRMKSMSIDRNGWKNGLQKRKEK